MRRQPAPDPVRRADPAVPRPILQPAPRTLIFTTHDATLLGSAMVERPLDRDEVWITSKHRTGETDLYCLIDAKPRKEENLERGYLRGRYGGIPRVTHGDIAREVADLRETR